MSKNITKKLIILFLIIPVVLILTGCFEMETSLNIGDEGETDVTLMIRADKHMAGDELNIYTWGLINSIPQLKDNYEITKEERTIDYSSYSYYIFESKQPIDINDNENIVFEEDNGSYQFRMEIPGLIDEVTEDNKDDLAYTFVVTLPEEIDMANSRKVDGNKVQWEIYYSDLVKGTTLKAMTK